MTEYEIRISSWDINKIKSILKEDELYLIAKELGKDIY